MPGNGADAPGTAGAWRGAACSRRSWLVAALALATGTRAQPVFDHGHAAWQRLLARHVRWLPDGKQSRVDYAGFQADAAALGELLAAYGAVTPEAFQAWTRAERMALLINAYNAFTVQLVLGAYPRLKSIKDLGNWVQSPWKKTFFRLLGASRSLDWIEHEQLRPLYQDPRVHTAINCASIGCPALRDEAFTASRLEAQLEDGMQRFLGDRSRNRLADDGVLEVSAIFKWFRADFEQGQQGFQRVEDVFAKHAARLTDNAAGQARLRARSVGLRYLDYDWNLNAVGR